ncbi:MAG: trypsin-like peptidase domain-containing protein [Brevinema sp.]
MNKKNIFSFIAGVIILSASLGFFNILQAQKQSLDISTVNEKVENMSELKSVLSLQSTLREISKTITPGVVSISVEGTVTRSSYQDPLFQFFFGNNEHLQRKYSTAGSGFIITPDGYLFSNWHVVENANSIKVTLFDGREFDAKLIGADTELDVALLKIHETDLPVVPIGNSDETEVGDLVIAIGNPFGLSGTFTFGAISGVGREGFFPGLQRFLQSDVAVNPGNSGGPLINIKGQAIGINTAIRSQSGGYEGISFALPINTAKNIAEQLFSSGTIERGFLGIVPQELDTLTRKSLNLATNEGVVASSLELEGPAGKSGLKQGDIITKIDGVTISTPSQLTEMIATKAPSSSVEIEILRDNTRSSIVVMLGKRPSNIIKMENESDAKSSDTSSIIELHGISFAQATARELKHNGAESGVVVKKISPNSPLSFILSSGDVISKINNYPISSISSLEQALPQLQNSRRFTFAIYKGGYLVYRSIEF